MIRSCGNQGFLEEMSSNHEITSSIDSFSILNFNFLKRSYVSLDTRICGCSDWGTPLVPGIKISINISNLNTLSMSSTDIYKESE